MFGRFDSGPVVFAGRWTTINAGETMTLSEALDLGWGTRAEAYATWRTKVDYELVRACGLTGEDLGDADYAQYFEDGATPAQAARMVLEVNDFPFEDGEDGEDWDDA